MSSRRRAASRGDATRPVFEPLVTTVIDLFVESLDTPTANENVSAMRSRMAIALLKFDQLCKATRALVRERAMLPYLRFYYSSMLVTPNAPARFLDRTFGVSLFEGCFGDGPSDPAKFDVLNVRDALHDRTVIALRLASMNDIQLKKCKKYEPRDLPAGVPPRVAAFVGRARMIAQRLAARTPAMCVPCERAGCGRLLLHDRSAAPAGLANGAPIVQDVGSDTSDSEDEPPADPEEFGHAYWDALATRPRTRLPPRVFCSCTCAQAYDDEVAEAVPVRLSDLEADFGCSDGKLGLSRIAVESRRCFERNAAVARAFRAAARAFERRALSTISKSAVVRMRQDVVDTLNVDLALVYAASVIAESPPACVARRLPATGPSWRDDAKAWRMVIRAIQQIYTHSWRGGDGIATDERMPPPWLKQVRNRVYSLFPNEALV